MSKRTFTLIFTLFTVAFILVMVALYTPSSSDIAIVIPTPKVIPTMLAQTSLRFGTSTKLPVAISSPEAKMVYSLPITISTENNRVTAVQIEMSYDPKVLTEVVVTPGSFFEKPVIFLNHIDDENGRISYAIGVSPNEQGKDGEGLVATLSFQGRSKVKQTNISFLPKTLVMAEGVGQSVLKSTNSATIKTIDN